MTTTHPDLAGLQRDVAALGAAPPTRWPGERGAQRLRTAIDRVVNARPEDRSVRMIDLRACAIQYAPDRPIDPTAHYRRPWERTR